MNLKNIKKVHIIGIEGAGTSALALMFNSYGIKVSGSDEGDHFYFDTLKNKGIKIFHGFKANNISKDVDLIIYSTAFKPETNVELEAALRGKTKVINYPKALSMLFENKYGIAVAGTHGKTTTTAWLAYVLDKSGYAPSAIVGSKVLQFNNSSLVGKSEYFIVETDEYQNKLKYYFPKAAILNNIEYDHPDFFQTEEEYKEVFIEFIKKIPKKGFLIANFDDPVIQKTANVNCRGRVITYAIDEAADYVAYDIKTENVRQYFKVHLTPGPSPSQGDGRVKMETNELGGFAIQLTGRHNISNALAVIATAIELDVPLNELRAHLENFQGTARRMQVMGKYRGAILIDDYAHHPTEVKATLAAATEKYTRKNIIAVFQPHTFTRTRALLKDFATSFNQADELIVLDIYSSAREEQGGVHSEDLLKQIRRQTTDNRRQNIKYIPTVAEVADYLKREIGSNDVVVFMGAGDVYLVGNKLLDL